MNAKHTPGPWHIGPHYRSDVESREGRVCECTPLGSPRAEANARLIAAAPALLECVRAFIEAWDKSSQLEKTDVAVRQARALLARIERSIE